jgi:hypothetical protein
MRILPLLSALPLTLVLAACGSDDAPPVSKGQQLNDLQKAYQNRAITDDEYEEEKENVLDQ